MRLDKIVVGRASKPIGGYLHGRVIPKEKLSDKKWTDLLELEKPPDDGLYIPRQHMKDPKALQKIAQEQRKDMPVKVLWRLVKAAAANKKPSKSKAVKQAPESDIFALVDWNEISPDQEVDALGLENLEKNQHLAIVGAGISGLSLAWILNRCRPDLKITILDKKPEVGGWMRSTPGPDNSVFESGPRTLLPSHAGTTVLMKILAQLGKLDQVAGVPRSSPTNQKGIVYNDQVVELPRGLWPALRFLCASPVLKGARWGILKELWLKPRPKTEDDESVDAFISRRFGSPIAQRMVSALMRGIYAADSRELSARSVARLNRMFYLERTEGMSSLSAAVSGSLGFLDAYGKTVLPLLTDVLITPSRNDPVDVDISQYSLLAFKDGIQSLPRMLAADLESRKNVEIKLNTDVASIKSPSASKVVLETEQGNVQADMAVCTVASPGMFTSKIQEQLKEIPYSSLAVVNVYVPEKVDKDWFGILVPKCDDEFNKHSVLGIIFDSSVRNAALSLESKQELPQTTGSSMTVMIGGDLWSESMTEQEAKEKALAGLQHYLGKFDTSQAVVNVALQRNCIPKYTVGHSERVNAIHAQVASTYRNRLHLTGTALGRGVGISDCIVDSLSVASRFADQRKLVHPEFFFNNYLSVTRPSLYA